MSNGSSEFPFASPESAGPSTPEWQGTPVPTAAAPVPPPPPHVAYAQAPPPPGAYVTPEATAYPAAPKPYGAHYPSDDAASVGAQAASSHSAPVPQPPVNIPPPPVAQHYPQATAVAYPPPPPGYGYGYPPMYAPGSEAKNWMGITSLVLSLATLAVGFTCIGGIIFGHMGLAAAKRGEANNRGIALAGVIIGWVFFGLGLLFVALMVVVIATEDTSTY